MTILNELENYLKEDDYKWYNFGFDVARNDIDIPEGEEYKLKENLSGVIEGDIGTLEDVVSVLYDDTLSVTGQIKLDSDTSYETYKKNPAQIALNIYNKALLDACDTVISDVDVVFNDETEQF